MFEEFKNSLDFYLRRRINFSRKNFIEKNPELIQRNIQENLYTTDVLEKYFEKKNDLNIKILDIGSKNWFYAKGEYEYFNAFADNFSLDGIEIDAYRLYSNFYNRYEVAKYYIKDLKNTKYIIGNLLDLNEKYDYIIWFLPFVLPEPHIAWGLPKKYFYPKRLLKHAYSLLNNDGQLLIINQGKHEAEAQKSILEELKIDYKYLGEIKSDYFEYQNSRFGYLIQK